MKEVEEPAKDAPETKPGHDEIAKKAYAIYLKEGRPQGHEVQNWLEAEAKMPPAEPGQPKGEAWHSKSAEEVLAKFRATAAGLSVDEVRRRQKESRSEEHTSELQSQ